MHDFDPRLEQAEPNGYCFRFCVMINGVRILKERFFFFGKTAWEEARQTFLDFHKPSTLGDYPAGVYELSLHNAWKGSYTEPDEYDDTTKLDKKTVKVEHHATITWLS